MHYIKLAMWRSTYYVYYWDDGTLDHVETYDGCPAAQRPGDRAYVQRRLDKALAVPLTPRQQAKVYAAFTE